MNSKDMNSGGYQYIPGVMQYSGGVAAKVGYKIVRARFLDLQPMEQGFQKIEQHLERVQRPLDAFCACELRSPAQFSQQGFADFNQGYAETLRQWGIMQGNDNPIARSNVCPAGNQPSSPSFHAFSYTVEADIDDQSFVIAGSGEAPEGKGDYADVTVAYGDTSEAGLRFKAEFVLGEMERRMSFFKATWQQTTAVQLYTVFNAYPLISAEMSERGVIENGICWHYCRPPVVGLDFEMDCRRVTEELVLL